jgi:NADH-quinone oxidoreductase subunit J
MSAPQVIFYVFAAIAVISALSMLLHVRNIVAAALSLVVTMVSLAGIFVLLGAHLVAVIQIMVYGGAIVVLFLFVVMLLDLREDHFSPSRQRILKLAGAGFGLFLLFEALRLLAGLPDPPPAPAGFGGHRQLGVALFTDYLLLVEVVSLLLTAAIVGSLILAKRDID